MNIIILYGVCTVISIIIMIDMVVMININIKDKLVIIIPLGVIAMLNSPVKVIEIVVNKKIKMIILKMIEMKLKEKLDKLEVKVKKN